MFLHYPADDRCAIAVEIDRERDYNTMSTATDTTQQPNKRTRFSENDPLSSSDTSSHKVQPPKILAESFLRATTSSLHPLIAPDIEKLGKEHLTLLSKKNHLDKANQRLVDDKELIPSSARIKFELSVSDRVKEMPEYKALQESTVEVITEAHNKLKTQIITASKLEIKAITIELKHHLVKAIRLITNAYLLLNNDKTNVDEAVYILVSHHIHSMSIHIPMSLRDFIIIYKEVHTIDTFPPRSSSTNTTTTTRTTRTSTTPTNNNPTVSPFFLQQHQQQQEETKQEEKQQEPEIIIVSDHLKKVKSVIEDVFVTSWTRFLEQQSKNELSLQLKKLSTMFFTTRSTSEATAIVDAEPAADKKELKALIRLETISETKNLLKQLNDIKKQLNNLTTSKNSTQRGNGSASVKKTKTTNKNSRNNKKKTPSSSKKNSGQNKKGKVVDNNNANDSGAKNSKKKNGKNKSNKNGKSSSNKKHPQNNKSSKK